MIRKRTVRVTASLAVLALFACCYYLIYTPPQAAKAFSILEKSRNIEEYLRLFSDVRLDGIYTQEKAGFIEIPKDSKSQTPPEAYLDFIHISDVQLHDERAQLYNRVIARALDLVVPSIKLRLDQEKYDYAVLQCLLLGINSYAEEEREAKPAFLIHTGDSVHLSLVSELWEFLSIFNQSLKALPWFNVIGNHDVTVFGTTALGKSSLIKDPSLAFLPISPHSLGKEFSPLNFINFHRCREIIVSGIPVQGPIKHCPNLEQVSPYAFNPSQTEYQGFDLYSPQLLPDKVGRTPQKLKGYYAFECSLRKNLRATSPLEKIMVIVLNTSEYVSKTAQGGFSQNQVEWLKDILKDKPDEKTRVIAFGHHPLIANIDSMRGGGIHKKRLETVLRLFKDHVDVYLCGHAHKQGYHERNGFLQIIAPSLIEFPQSGQKVRIAYHEDRFLVEIVPFSHRETEYGQAFLQPLDKIVALWEKDTEAIEAAGKIVAYWEKDKYLKTKDISDVVSLWKSDQRARAILEEIIRPYQKDDIILQALKKAVLLKQAFLARFAAAEDAKASSLTELGKNFLFSIPLRVSSLRPRSNWLR